MWYPPGSPSAPAEAMPAPRAPPGPPRTSKDPPTHPSSGGGTRAWSLPRVRPVMMTDQQALTIPGTAGERGDRTPLPTALSVAAPERGSFSMTSPTPAHHTKATTTHRPTDHDTGRQRSANRQQRLLQRPRTPQPTPHRRPPPPRPHTPPPHRHQQPPRPRDPRNRPAVLLHCLPCHGVRLICTPVTATVSRSKVR